MEEIFPDFEEFGLSTSPRPLISLEIPSIFMDLDTSGAHLVPGVSRLPGPWEIRDRRTSKTLFGRGKLSKPENLCRFWNQGAPNHTNLVSPQKLPEIRFFRLFQPRAIFGRAGPGPSEPRALRASRGRPGRARDEILGRSRDFFKGKWWKYSRILKNLESRQVSGL